MIIILSRWQFVNRKDAIISANLDEREMRESDRSATKDIPFFERLFFFLQAIDEVVDATKIIGRVVIDDDFSLVLIACGANLGAENALHVSDKGSELRRNTLDALGGHLLLAL